MMFVKKNQKNAILYNLVKESKDKLSISIINVEINDLINHFIIIYFISIVFL